MATERGLYQQMLEIANNNSERIACMFNDDPSQTEQQLCNVLELPQELEPFVADIVEDLRLEWVREHKPKKLAAYVRGALKWKEIYHVLQ